MSPFPEYLSDGVSISSLPLPDLSSSFCLMENTLEWHSNVTLIELQEKNGSLTSLNW